MTTEEFVIPAEHINHYASISQWMAVRDDVWFEVDRAEQDALQYGEMGGCDKRLEDLIELAQRIDDAIRMFFGMTHSDLMNWKP